MKKMKSMRMASVLLALVLITFCFVGNTFAKYVKSNDATDTARVAKFGVEILGFGDTTQDGLFKTSYATDETGTGAYTGTMTVTSSSTDSRVVAPGTKGTMAGIKLSGTPEVAVRISFKLDTTATKFDNWTVKDGSVDKFYCPLVFTVGTSTIDGKTYGTAAALVSALETAVNAYSADLAPNTDLSSATNLSSVAISWAWPFYVSDANDIFDTQLGDAAAAGTAIPSLALAFSVTITQID